MLMLLFLPLGKNIEIVKREKHETCSQVSRVGEILACHRSSKALGFPSPLVARIPVKDTDHAERTQSFQV